MPDYTTPYYLLVKPEIDGSAETWGQKLNADLDIVDTNLKRVDTRAFACLPKDGSEEATAMLKYASTQTPPVNDQDIPNKKYVDDAIKLALLSLFPIGTVIMWSGYLNDIPLNWGLCNGELQEGRIKPNLLDRFVIAAGGAYPIHQAGGTGAHSHGGWVGATAIDTNMMPWHAHGVRDLGHQHDIVGTNVTTTTATGGNSRISWQGSFKSGVGYAAMQMDGAGANAAHGHTIAAESHIPYYYALYFIIRVK
jgi:hypothetical protein